MADEEPASTDAGTPPAPERDDGDRRFRVRWTEGLCGAQPLAALREERDRLLAGFRQRAFGDATFLYDPRAEACWQCPDNLLLLRADGGAAEGLTRAGLYLGVGWAIALAALATRKSVRGSHASRPIAAAGAVYLLLVAATFSISLDRGLVDNGSDARRLWLGQAAALYDSPFPNGEPNTTGRH